VEQPTTSNNVGIGGTAPSTSPSLYVGADGKVGIGTTGPSYKLHVFGSEDDGILAESTTGHGPDIKSLGSRTNAFARIRGATDAGGGLLELTSIDGTRTVWLRGGQDSYFNGGNVGIGTTDPSSFKLQVAGDVGPQTDSAHNIGSDSVRWAKGYFDDLYATTIHGEISGTDRNWSIIEIQ